MAQIRAGSYLVAEPECVGVAAVVEERHGGEDGTADGDDVELGDVVVLQDALRHLQAVGGSDLCEKEFLPNLAD